MESTLGNPLTRRQLFCKSALGVVCVDNIGGGAIIEYFGNAHSQLRQQGVTIVSGWRAEPGIEVIYRMTNIWFPGLS